jgi:hypothetical protein
VGILTFLNRPLLSENRRIHHYRFGRARLKPRSKRPENGVQSVRENAWRPFGTRAYVPLHPALPCRAFISRRYAAGVLVVLVPPLAFNSSSHAVSSAPDGFPLRRSPFPPQQLL